MWLPHDTQDAYIYVAAWMFFLTNLPIMLLEVRLDIANK